ncbi:virion structural protein [Yersinia phage vB_YenS_P400]|nr:virion structural protein [Yersinia phage vB_YenS_P400]
MTPVYDLFRDYIVASEVVKNYTLQMHFWDDTGKPKDKFVVIQTNGGSALREGLGADYFILMSIIGNKNEFKAIGEKANELIQYITNNPKSDCLSLVEAYSGLPAPILTDEGRIVFRIPVRIIN